MSVANFNSISDGTIETRSILENPRISLYCLDDRQQQAVFVETQLDTIALSDRPFFYQAQFETAQRLITLDYNELHQLADRIKKRLSNLILIYSVGRCGSTLLSKALGQSENKLSLSEPDVFSQIVNLREANGSRDRDILKLIESCARILCKPIATQSFIRWAIKFRGLGIGIADLFHQAFPDARSIFLYRHAEDTVTSFVRNFGIPTPEIFAAIEQNIEYHSRAIPPLKSYFPIEYNRTNAINFYTIRWLWFMERYVQLYHQSIPMQAIRYEDLRDRSREVISAIFEYLNIPTSEVEKACQVLTTDSQAGSMLANDKASRAKVTPQDTRDIRRFLQHHPEIQRPDFQVPGTLLLGNC
ncbi:sulfotransferase domain-containing protein [Oscillatoriales cyanobacterium LEGE 11467]|uniref:Sulfotransferase domain-containing protein n=1 Tax=Zarconia navalis LEGE 11467 TaxID=1828826 RepID=A0A928VYQ2_9CYAN|nr:sulfotransferase [Zarconia navalis]MBE9041267.1 sulfotransferase domain-containing protein [Zarconia navalis LEGE 11467]